MTDFCNKYDAGLVLNHVYDGSTGAYSGQITDDCTMPYNELSRYSVYTFDLKGMWCGEFECAATDFVQTEFYLCENTDCSDIPDFPESNWLLWECSLDDGTGAYDGCGNCYFPPIYPPQECNLPGCTDIYAQNWNSSAVLDDGSCCYTNECLAAAGLEEVCIIEWIRSSNIS